MSWFEEQLRYRKESDNANFEDSIDTLANAVMGTRLRDALSKNEVASSAINQILQFYHFKEAKEDSSVKFKTLDEQIEYSMRPYGIKCRKVNLNSGWYKHAVGAMLGTLKEDGLAVALIPGKFSSYRIVDIATGARIQLNKKTEDLIDSEAVCFYKPLPERELRIADLLSFMLKQLSLSDIIFYILLMLASTCLGLLTPWITKWLFGDVLMSESVEVLLALAVFVICYSISKFCFDAFNGLINSRIVTKQNVAVQAAVVNRIISLPTTFFKKYSAGELSRRASYVQSLCSTIFSTIGMTGLTSAFSLMYIAQIFKFARSLVLPAMISVFATLALTLITAFTQMKVSREIMEHSAKTSGLTYSMITGIQKIKLAGAEKRMFSRWAREYSKEARLSYNPPVFLRLSGTIGLLISLTTTIFMYATAIHNHVSIDDYYAFNAAYGMVSAAFMSVVSIATTLANIKPILQMAKPILEAVPEKHENKENVKELRGEIELSHVSFRYEETGPNVIDDLSLRVAPGEYVAIVGQTGCGKSTLMRLILGFETPQKGSVFFDKKDINSLDLESLRQKIGSVMQDGKLFSGDIYSNIVITAPQLGLKEAWEAAEIASIADNIRSMPMGMNTLISEGQGGISGGQKQRLLIARAVAPKPKILIFDEATSALDNIAQRNVSQAIDSLKCTRIVIAHRLSTIQHADRIIYLENGKIAEDGTYEELIEKNGRFANLVERQRLDYKAEED